MIVDRYLFREIIFNFFSVLTVLLLLFSSKHFVRYMSYAAEGHLPTEFIFKLLSLFVLVYLVLLGPFALYISILITLGRWYKDSEITALAACGVGIPRITRTAFLFSLVLASLMAVMALWVAPWAEHTEYRLRDQAAMESEVSYIAPGRFHEIRGGSGVFYIETMSDDRKTMREIFVQLEENGKTDIFSADTGYLRTDSESGAQFLVLKNGYRMELLPPGQGFRVHEYAEAGVQIAQPETKPGELSPQEKPTVEILGSENLQDIAELQWRISMPISCVLLTLLAVLLSKTDPRQGRFSKLFVALIIYLVYVYMMILTRTWIAGGKVPPLVGMWWIHLVIAALIGFLMMRQFGWSFRRVKPT